jgi:DNA recombination protein RmuC
MDATAVLMLLIGLALGALVGVLWARYRNAGQIATLTARAQVASDRLAAAEQRRLELVEQRQADRQQLSESFQALSAEALRTSSEHLLTAADNQLSQASKPIRDTLDRMDVRLREIEAARSSAQATLAQQIDSVRLTSESLRTQTAALVTALRKPQVRGQWGELHLRRVVEIAGLVERCDFDTQTTVNTEDAGIQRPDLVVHLAGGKHVVVDAKVPLAAFLEAAEAGDDEQVRADRLRAHARQLRAHADQLGSKAYWQALAAVGMDTPEFVVLFVPGDSFLSHAVEYDPDLLEHTARHNVVIATPTTLITLLRTVAYAWTQDNLAANARQVFELGRDLYGRLGTLGGHVDRLGRSLNGAVGAYNKAVGSLESRVLVSARRLHELGITSDELTAPEQVDTAARALSAPELVESAEQDGRMRALPALVGEAGGAGQPGDDELPLDVELNGRSATIR